MIETITFAYMNQIFYLKLLLLLLIEFVFNRLHIIINYVLVNHIYLFKNFREHMQKYQIAHLQKKKSNYDIKKRDVSMFISSIIGALQSLEYKFIYMLDEADQVYNNSMNKVMNQLNNLIEVSIYYRNGYKWYNVINNLPLFLGLATETKSNRFNV